MNKELKVTGKGKVSIKPDLIRVRIEIGGTESDYASAVQASSDATNAVKDSLVKLGFEKSDVKTLNYEVQTTYESYQARDRSWKRRFSGYKYSHKMKIEFPADNEKLGQVLYAIAHCGTNPEFNIEYTVADPEAAKDELLRKAIEDSKHKAQVLADAAGMTIEEILSINYSWGEIDFVTRPYSEILNNICCDDDCDDEADIAMPMGYGMDVEPDDIKVTDTVTVIWSIK